MQGHQSHFSMELKKCFKCEVEKPRTDFYKHKGMADGLLGKCKLCAKKDVNKNREDNLDRIQEYDRNRPNHLERQGRNRAYAKTEKGAVATKKGKRAWYEKNKHKRSAMDKVGRAVRAGKLSKLPCVVCGEERVEAHHPNYDEPLNVVWLCTRHHADMHKMLRERERNGS